mgnify:CR=1 FL=1
MCILKLSKTNKNHMLKAKYFILLICFSFLLKTEAKVTLTSIWGDNMVLQQQSEVTFSGTATWENVCRLPLHGIIKNPTNVDAKGEWKLSLQTPVAGGPYSITFSDGEDLTLQNILIGEVWFCSGQSNMEMPVKGFRGQPVFGSQPYIVSANPKRPLRLYTVKMPGVPFHRKLGWTENGKKPLRKMSLISVQLPISLAISYSNLWMFLSV